MEWIKKQHRTDIDDIQHQAMKCKYPGGKRQDRAKTKIDQVQPGIVRSVVPPGFSDHLDDHQPNDIISGYPQVGAFETKIPFAVTDIQKKAGCRCDQSIGHEPAEEIGIQKVIEPAEERNNQASQEEDDVHPFSQEGVLVPIESINVVRIPIECAHSLPRNPILFLKPMKRSKSGADEVIYQQMPDG